MARNSKPKMPTKPAKSKPSRRMWAGYTPTSKTSRAAAVAKNQVAKTQVGRIIELFKKAGRRGLTNGEIYQVLNRGLPEPTASTNDPRRVPHGQISSRVAMLKSDGVVAETGEQRKNMTGEPAAVCVFVRSAPADYAVKYEAKRLQRALNKALNRLPVSTRMEALRRFAGVLQRLTE